MNKIGIIGAGIMGRGVAQVFAKNKYQVILVDIKEEALKSAEEEIYNTIRIQNMIQGDCIKTEPLEILKNITFTNNYKHLSDRDFIIENVPENIQIKQSVYTELDEICKKETIFAANTSCIPITELASFTRRPEQVIGIHFMNPVSFISTVEVMLGYHTGAETIACVKALLKDIGIESIEVKDYAGFVSNRISHLMINEAVRIVYEQEAEKEAVDDIFKKCYGHKMGPLETADLIGLDTVVDSLDVLYHYYKEEKYSCCPLLRRMVKAGLLGRKAGEGFYIY